jgi:PAS domain S-box-containing protein
MIEKELALQTSLLKTMISALPDAVFCKDLNFKYTLCNKYMADIFDKNFEDILGKDDVTALGLPAETAALANDVDRRVINERLRVVYEEWICGADGVNRLFETVKTPLMQDGVLIGLLGIGRDITQRKAMEEEVRAASFAKTAFLANMSHEIRTPLNVVIGLTDMVLEENNLSAHVSENLIKINNAGSTLLSIVNDLLDFSKIESGKLTLIPGEYHMSSMLNDVITIVTTSLGEKPISFSLNISDDLPGRLYGDDLRVKQIFNNLLSNAIKYTHRGSIELRVNCTRESEDWRMEISVSDTGIGIRDGDIKKLFHDYYQADLRSNRNITGTGLGLSITMRLVQMMGGEISVESEYGSGSAFHVYVRQGFVDDTPIGPAVANNLRSFHYADDKRIATKRLIRLNLSYAKVLVVDDMQTNLDVSVGLLRKYKMQVDCLSSGQEALERIRGGFPVYNAIFMDHMMPGMDGIETTDAIRALDTEYARKVPIIALTANAIYGTEEMFYEHGFQAFISKPIDIMELDSIVRKWVQDKSQEAKTSDPDISVTDEDAKDENTAIVIPGVDVEKGLSLYSGDKDLYLLLLRSYVSNVPETLIKLGSVSKETLSNYVITVHGLKGTSAAIGAELIREEALNLETMSRAGDLNGVLTLNGRLISNTTVVVDNIKNWLEKYDAAAAKPRLRAPDPETLARLRQSCENFDMVGIDKALSELESVDYEEDADLITWLKEKIGTSEITAVAQRLLKYGEKPEK